MIKIQNYNPRRIDLLKARENQNKEFLEYFYSLRPHFSPYPPKRPGTSDDSDWSDAGGDEKMQVHVEKSKCSQGFGVTEGGRPKSIRPVHA